MIIDSHAHILPLPYLKQLRRAFKTRKVNQVTGSTMEDLLTGGTVPSEFYDITERLRSMDRFGIDYQVLSYPTPCIDQFELKEAKILAKLLNNEYGKISKTHDGRFVGLATLPLGDVGAAIDELERAVKELGLRGVTLPSNVAGKPLDSTEFWPLYAKIARLDIPMFIHPVSTLMVTGRVLYDYRLLVMLGYLFDTTLAALRLILKGIYLKYPRLKIVLPHAGGYLPYIIGRADRLYAMYSEVKQAIPRPPSHYLRLMYIDTVSLHPPALACAKESLGSNHLVFGTDYPYWPFKENLTAINKVKLSKLQKDQILGENAAQLFKIG